MTPESSTSRVTRTDRPASRPSACCARRWRRPSKGAASAPPTSTPWPRCCGRACTARSRCSSRCSRSSWPRAPAAPDLVEQVENAASAASWPSRRALLASTDMVSLARKNLLHDRLRFAITVAGVAFAVTLVLVQVGLFMGLLDKATVTIEHATRRHLGHLEEHAERGLRAHLPGDGGPARARRARRGARRQPDRPVHEHPAPERGRGGLPRVRASRTSRPGTCPGTSRAGTWATCSAGAYILMDRSAERRFGRLRDRRLPRDPPPALQDHRHHPEAASFTTAPIVFMDYRSAQELQRDPAGPDLATCS